jgi:hypothetical protein
VARKKSLVIRVQRIRIIRIVAKKSELLGSRQDRLGVPRAH